MDKRELLPHSESVELVEELYWQFVSDPQQLSQDWRDYFQGMANGHHPGTKFALKPSFQPASLFNPPSRNGHYATGGNGVATTAPGTMVLPQAGDTAAQQHRVSQMARAYREWGHRVANLDPLGREREPVAELDPAFYGF